MFAAPAGIVQPRHACEIALTQALDTAAERGDHADTLVPRDEWQPRLHRPVAVGRVQVCVADAAGLHLEQHFARARTRYG